MALLGSIALSLTHCKKQDPEAGRTVLRVNLQEGEPPSLNPYVGVDLRSRCLFLALFEPLMRRTPSGELVCAAASQVECDPTQTVYTFHIRPHKWSNGEQVTAYHFEKAWKYALTPATPCFKADLFYPIKNGRQVKKGELGCEELGIRCPDPSTLIVTLEHPTPYFLELTATSFFAPMYHLPDQEPLDFNGPYMVDELIHDQKLVFKTNPYYWDKERIGLDEIEFSMIRDPMTAYALFEKGELDVVGDPYSPLPFDLVPELEKSGELHSKTISRIFYLLLNTESLPLQNKHIRQALAASIDRDLLTQHLFFGEIPTETLVPVTLSSLPSDSSLTSNYKEAFAKGLAELNLPLDSFPTLTLSYAELSGQKKLAEFVQSQWQEKLGISVQLCCSEWNVHSANLKQGNYQIGTLHLTTLYSDPMFYFDLFKDKSSLTNYCRWENEAFRTLLDRAGSCLEMRAHTLYEAEKLLLEEMPAIALFTQNLHYLVRKDIHLEISDLGIYDFKNSTVALSMEEKR